MQWVLGGRADSTSVGVPAAEFSQVWGGLAAQSFLPLNTSFLSSVFGFCFFCT